MIQQRRPYPLGNILHRGKNILLLLGVALGLCILLLQAFPFTVQAVLAPEFIQPLQGHAYTAPFPGILKGRLAFLLNPASDSNDAPQASSVRLLEQNTALEHPHSVHQEIISLGAGRFSHWQNYLVFSASDNSDPRTNRHTYTIDYPLAPPLWLALALLVPGLLMSAVSICKNATADPQYPLSPVDWLKNRTWRYLRLLTQFLNAFIARPRWFKRSLQDNILRSGANILLLLGVVLGLCILLLQAFPFTIRSALAPQFIQPLQGQAYTAPVTGILKGRLAFLFDPASDSNYAPRASSVRLLEQNTALEHPHSVHQEIISLGAGRFSHWQNYLVFSASDNSDPRINGRTYDVEYPLAPSLWLAALLALPGILRLGHKRAIKVNGGPALGSPIPQTSVNELLGGITYYARSTAQIYNVLIARPRWFVAFAVVLALYYNVIYWALLPAPVVAPDSDSYLGWSRFRTLGYSVFLDAYQALSSGWDYLPIVQLNLMLAGMFTLAYAIGRLCKNFGASLLFLALVHAGGQLLLYPAHMLTEGPFAAFLMLHFGLLLLLLDKQSSTRALLSGLALAGAILIKSVGVVFLFPLALVTLLMSMPRRFLLVATLLLPGFAAYLGPSAYNYARIGVFESSVAGGYSLAGQVGWGIHANSHSPYQELARRIEARLQPILAKRPDHFSTLEEYATYTTNEYNTLLWQNIVPETRNYFVCEHKPCTWPVCKAENNCTLIFNKALLSLSKDAILDDPAKYAYHVFAHYYGMWRYLFTHQDFMQGMDYYAVLLPNIYTQNNLYWQRRLGFSTEQIKSFTRPDALRTAQQSIGSKLVNAVTFQYVLKYAVFTVLKFFPQIMLGLSLIACTLIFGLHRRSPIAVAFCYGGLLLNAYFMGHALAQVVLDRYSMLMQGIALATLLLGLTLIGKRLKHLVAPRTYFSSVN